MTTETELPSKMSSTGNVVEGFSDRFNFLLDRARWPKQNRMSLGARRFNVVPNTFKHWLVSNRIPGTHAALIEITEQILADVPGRYNPKAVVAWLLAGDAVPNPFGDDNSDAIQLVNLYLQISEIAKSEGVDFNALPREVRNLILKRVRTMQPATDESDGAKLDGATLSLVIGMLETAKSMT